MATYTNSTPAGYLSSKYRQHNTRTAPRPRRVTNILSRVRPTSAASMNAKRIFGAAFPAFGASLNTGFTPGTGAVTRSYRNAAIGDKARTR